MLVRVIAVALLAGLVAYSEALPKANPVYLQRFQTQYNKIHNPSNGYFNQDGIPYHSVETLICEAPDYGHLTTSEAYSYWVWLEAMNGYYSGNFNSLQQAYSLLEANAIPTNQRQPTNQAYNPSAPATYAPEGDEPSDYPEALQFGCAVGLDPLHDQLTAAYGTPDIYGMHWLFDADNWYEYGVMADGTSRNGAINTFQRGPNESVWKTIPQPEWEIFKWGGPDGFLDLFTSQPPPYSPQWRYTNAPDADARTIQAIYWAYLWANENNNSTSGLPISQASKMGDYLRYAMFDKYFKTVGSQTPCGSQTDWYGGFHGLISWYYAWGGYLTPFPYPWGFRIGCEYAHFGYQNPVAAYALSSVAPFKPTSSNGVNDWTASLNNQLNFYAWLQSAEGAIAGGATSSWDGQYAPYPPGTTTFNNMAYTYEPTYDDPPSNSWFGWQTWSMERLAEYYYLTGDSRAGNVMSKWVNWAMSVTVFNSTTNLVTVPANLYWSGQPNTWTGSPSVNSNLHVSYNGTDAGVGTLASLAHACSFYAAKSGSSNVQQFAKKILDWVWAWNETQGVSVWESRPDYCGFSIYTQGFNQTVYVPPSWTGNNAQGANIKSGITFSQMRPKYVNDPGWSYLQSSCSAGNAPQYKYHRFWEQAEVAIANGDYARLFPSD